MSVCFNEIKQNNYQNNILMIILAMITILESFHIGSVMYNVTKGSYPKLSADMIPTSADNFGSPESIFWKWGSLYILLPYPSLLDIDSQNQY